MSMPLVYATLAPLPGGVDPTAWVGLSPRLIGWDGSEWELSNPASGVLLMRGARGFGMPDFQRFSSSSAAVAGSRWRGRSTAEREVFLPLLVHTGDGSEAFVALENAFWRIMHPERPCTLVVSVPGDGTRSLTARFVDDGGAAFGMLPLKTGWHTYPVTLVAEDPFWRGATQLRTWTPSPPVPFFGVDGLGGPPFYISSSSALGSASIANPGDEDAFPVWVITGPATEATVGVGGRVVEVPFAVAEGEALVIDTRPTAQTATLIDAPPAGLSAADLEAHIAAASGTSRTRDLGGATEFAPVPPGQSVPVEIAMTGTGSVQMLLGSAYWRAW